MVFTKEYCIGVLLLASLCLIKKSQSETPTENPLDRQPIVQTENGPIKGSVLQTRLGEQFLGFRGIRYGKAPVGDLRFKVSVSIIICVHLLKSLN